MNCMRCGRDIPLGQAFCKECLADMEQHPVKPDTPVQLPSPPPPVQHKTRTHNRKQKKPEEQLVSLRKRMRLQTLVFILVVLLLIGSTLYFAYKLYSTQNFLPGQNYRSFTYETLP